LVLRVVEKNAFANQLACDAAEVAYRLFSDISHMKIEPLSFRRKYMLRKAIKQAEG
jgi:hypothetical protein